MSKPVEGRPLEDVLLEAVEVFELLESLVEAGRARWEGDGCRYLRLSENGALFHVERDGLRRVA